jgi:hypothetical protein
MYRKFVQSCSQSFDAIKPIQIENASLTNLSQNQHKIVVIKNLVSGFNITLFLVYSENDFKK